MDTRACAIDIFAGGIKSCAKQQGRGANGVSKPAERWLIASPGKTPWRLRQYQLEPDYKLTVCASHAAFPAEVGMVDWRVLTGSRLSGAVEADSRLGVI